MTLCLCIYFVFTKKSIILSLFEIDTENLRISILEIPCVPIFRENGQLKLFWPKFAPKWVFFDWKLSKNVEIKISTSREHVCQFSSKTDYFDFFGPNLPKNGFRVENSEN